MFVACLRIEGIVRCVALACIRLVYEVLTVPGRRLLVSNLELCSGLHCWLPVETLINTNLLLEIVIRETVRSESYED